MLAAAYLYSFAGPGVDVALRVELYAIGDAGVDIREDAAVRERLGCRIDVECVADVSRSQEK